MANPLSENQTTDAEYIEKVRKRLGRGKKFALLYFLIAAMELGLGSWVINKAYKLAKDLLNSDPSQPSLSLGMTFGVLAGLILMKAGQHVVCVIKTLKGDKTEKLLVYYYDEAKLKE